MKSDILCCFYGPEYGPVCFDYYIWGKILISVFDSLMYMIN